MIVIQPTPVMVEITANRTRHRGIDSRLWWSCIVPLYATNQMKTAVDVPTRLNMNQIQNGAAKGQGQMNETLKNQNN